MTTTARHPAQSQHLLAYLRVCSALSLVFGALPSATSTVSRWVTGAEMALPQWVAFTCFGLAGACLLTAAALLDVHTRRTRGDGTEVI